MRRLDRLITDISDASRLDAELARETCKPVNMAGLLDAICSIVNDIHRKDAPQIVFKLEGFGRQLPAEQAAGQDKGTPASRIHGQRS